MPSGNESGNESSGMEDEEEEHDGGGSGTDDDSDAEEEQKPEQPKVWTCGVCTSENDLLSLGPYVEKACAVCHALRSGEPMWLCRNLDDLGGECDAINEFEEPACCVCGGVRAAAEPWSKEDLERAAAKGKKRGGRDYERTIKKAYKRPRGSTTSKGKGRKRRAPSSDDDEGVEGSDPSDAKGRLSGGGGTGRGKGAASGGKGGGGDKGKRRAKGTGAKRGGAGKETMMQVKGGMVRRAEPEPEPMSTDDDSDVEDPSVPKDPASFRSYIARKTTSMRAASPEAEGGGASRGGGRKRLSMPMSSGREKNAGSKRPSLSSPGRSVARGGGGEARGGMTRASPSSSQKRKPGVTKIARKGFTVSGKSLETGGGGGEMWTSDSEDSDSKQRHRRKKKEKEERSQSGGISLRFDDDLAAQRVWDGFADMWVKQMHAMHAASEWVRERDPGLQIYKAAKRNWATQKPSSQPAAAAASSSAGTVGGRGAGRSAGPAEGGHGGSRVTRAKADRKGTSEASSSSSDDGEKETRQEEEEKGRRGAAGPSVHVSAPHTPLVSYGSDTGDEAEGREERTGELGVETSTTEDEGEEKAASAGEGARERLQFVGGSVRSIIPLDTPPLATGTASASGVMVPRDGGEEGGVDEKGLDAGGPISSERSEAGLGRDKGHGPLTPPEEERIGKTGPEVPVEGQEDVIILADADEDEDVHLTLADDDASQLSMEA